MKNKMMKRSLLLVFTMMIGFTLTGCSDFDASRYVQSCLDASFHGEFEAYMEMTNSTEDEARSAYDSLIQSEVDTLAQGYSLSYEQKEKFRQLFTDMYKACKYEVGEATKNDDKSFTVQITTYKLTVFEGMTDSAQQYITEFCTNNTDSSTDEIYAAVLDYMYDYINDKLSNPEYAEGVTKDVSVPLTSTKPATYTIDTNDIQNLAYDLLDIENQ